MKEFKDFLLKTNALALAVGVIIGGAIGKVVSSLVNDLLMPPIGLLLGNVDFSNLFINAIINFVIVAFCIFLITKVAMRPAPAPAGPAMKGCSQCGEQVLAVAKKCRYCTSPV